ncbi:MAG: YkgJ family cysteine cluster protein [Planctomycetaceae bacterium]|nr:YkgJ family cysteine cluster protein [Planctomycetaceae bacterium]
MSSIGLAGSTRRGGAAHPTRSVVRERTCTTAGRQAWQTGALPLDEHDIDEDGEHDEEECELCLAQNHTVSCTCRCGDCCEQLIIEVSLRDAEREPRIRECSQIRGFIDEPVGYLLNDPANEHAYRFFDRTTRLCTIHETRPLVCRLFDCGSPDKQIGE